VHFGPKWPTHCWFQRRRHSIVNWGRVVTDSATVTMESLYRKPPSLFRMVPSLTACDLPFPQNGVPYAPKIREWAYLRNGWSDYVWFYRVSFSGSADRIALFPVTSNPSWRLAAILDNFEWPFDPLIGPIARIARSSLRYHNFLVVFTADVGSAVIFAYIYFDISVYRRLTICIRINMYWWATHLFRSTQLEYAL